MDFPAGPLAYEAEATTNDGKEKFSASSCPLVASLREEKVWEGLKRQFNNATTIRTGNYVYVFEMLNFN